MNLPDLKSLDVHCKKVFVRADLDVPVKNGAVANDARLKASLLTIEYLLNHQATVILAGHLGRPEGETYEERSKNKELSLYPVAQWFSQQSIIPNSKFIIQKTQIEEFDGWKLSDNFFILENLRFDEGEEENDSLLGKRLANTADIYVNDAFAVSHREHASIVGVPALIPHAAGLRLVEEVDHLSKVLENPERPLVVIVGGAKIETKLPLIEKMHQIADYVLVGGKLAAETTILLKVSHEKVENRKSELVVGTLTGDTKNITQESVEEFKKIISTAKTVIWNGPLGVDREVSVQVAQAIIDSKAYSVVGGGDTIEVLDAAGLTNAFSFVSTGGGAMLSLLSGEKQPGLDALR